MAGSPWDRSPLPPTRWPRRLHWMPGDRTWRIAVLFLDGAALFALGSFPLYGQLVPAPVVGVTFVVGSVLFTLAAAGQLLQASLARDRALRLGRGVDWWAAAVQLVGTVLFNVSTTDAMLRNLDAAQANRLVWAPDVLGSVAFLAASGLGWVAVCGVRWCRRRTGPWWIAALNAVGSGFFMLSALGAVTLPATGEELDATLVNSTTVAGAVCFFAGAWLLLPAPTRSSPRTRVRGP